MVTRKEHERFMYRALELAGAAAELGEVPVGAVVVGEGSEVLGEGFNRRIVDKDPTAHAEIIALKAAAARLGMWRLCGTRLYVTLEPCAMCAGALVNARVAQVVYGCMDPKAGSVRSLYTICEDPRLNHRMKVNGGILSDKCSQILSDFFSRLRSPRIE